MEYIPNLITFIGLFTIGNYYVSKVRMLERIEAIEEALLAQGIPIRTNTNRGVFSMTKSQTRSSFKFFGNITVSETQMVQDKSDAYRQYKTLEQSEEHMNMV